MHANDLNGQLVIIDQFAQLLFAVGAGSRYDLGAAGLDLASFGLSGHFHAERIGFVQRNQPAPAPAAVILAAMRLHFDEVGDETAQNLARLVDDPARAGDIAGIVIGDPLWNGLWIEFNFARPD